MSAAALKIFLYELRRGLRRRGYLYSAFGIPLLVLIALWVAPILARSAARDAAESAARQQTLNSAAAEGAGYVDLSGVFADVPDGSALVRYPDEAAALAALNAGEIRVYYRIEPDYLEAGSVTAVLPSLRLDSIDTDPIRELAYLTFTQGLDADVVTRLTRPPTFTTINLTLLNAEAGGGADEDGTFLVVYVFAIALLIGLFFTNGYLLQTVIEEKETRLIEILIASVRPADLLTGKILAMGLLGLLQMAIWVVGMVLAIQVAGGGADQLALLATIASIRLPPELFPLLAVYFVLAYLLFAALYGVVGALSNSLREGPQYAIVFTLPATFPLYFLSLFISAPDGILPTLMSLFPLTAPIAMIQRLTISAVPAWQVGVSLGLLALSCAAAIWLAGRVFRMQTLLAGQSVKLRDLPKLLRA